MNTDSITTDDKTIKNTEHEHEKSLEELQKSLSYLQTHNLRLGKIQENLEKDQSKLLNKTMSLVSTYEELQEDEPMVKEYTMDEMIEQAKKYGDFDLDNMVKEADADTKKNIEDYKSLVLDIK